MKMKPIKLDPNFENLVTRRAMENAGFITKDSGMRAEFPSGFVRDAELGKPMYHLIPLDQLKRLAELMGRGAAKYSARNWEKADPTNPAEMDRFRASAFRHFVQWMQGETDEDHAMGCVFNIFAYEHLTQQKEQS